MKHLITACHFKLILFVLAFIGCHPSTPLVQSINTDEAGSIIGDIKDDYWHQPIPWVDVHVRNTNYRTITDTSGSFSISNISVGNYILDIAMPGFLSTQKNVTIQKDQTQHVHFLLTEKPVGMTHDFEFSVRHSTTDSNPKGMITGHLSSCLDGSALKSGTVLTNVSGNLYGAEIDSIGNFYFSAPSGKMNIRFSAFGYNSFDTIIVLNAGDTCRIDKVFYTQCPADSQTAISDIGHGKPALMCGGGIAPLANTAEDDRFESIYGISYRDFGCQPIADLCLEQYNRIIFDYLDKNFGTAWRDSVRKDIYGYRFVSVNRRQSRK
jgi:hypothetical protein